MENLELEYHQNIANAYDLLRVVFFNQWREETVLDLKQKADALKDESKKLAFVQDIELIKGDALDTARWEYNRLFIGPQKPLATPFESVYRSKKKLMMRESTFEVREFYANVGLEVERKDHFPDDFIGFEFQYLFYVSQLTVALIEHKKEDEAIALIHERKDFLAQHPNQWFPAFCDDISNHSKEKIWKDLAEFILNISKQEETFFELFSIKNKEK
ncbi:TorD/DmsD family molecular chaperone [Sulfurospirillum sp. 1612]|uniref:TorD/DmsD family molecular chaperone n=1 Tax=Sulfurospirillum sp. 1612 TaxID=3094835 RepID=UPI002F95E798